MSSRLTIAVQDVSPANAQRVLNFLNAATSAQQIADTIELPGELDIGVHLAQRLLARRTQLGGFTTLQQVAAVPLIGPKRFTDIIISLTAQRPSGEPPSPIDALQQQLDALRRRVDAGSAGAAAGRRRLTLSAVGPHTFLGQPLSLVATLTEDEQPVTDVPIAFVATRGELSARDGYDACRGHFITARTGIDGIVRLTVQTRTTEALSPLQQDALLSMLGLLDAGALTPADVQAGLQAMAQQYAWEINVPFRQAVDIYVRDYHPQLLDTVNLVDNLSAWVFQDSAVLAFAPAEGTGEQGSSVAATATLQVRATDWIPAFLETFVALTRQNSTLTAELRDISLTSPDPSAMVNAMYDKAGAYVASRYGKVGAYVGRKVAESSIRGFLDQDLASLPLDTRIDLFPALDVASRTIAHADVGVIQGLVSTRKDITQDVDRKIGKGTVTLGLLNTRVGKAEAQLTQVPDNTALLNLRTEMLNAVQTSRNDLTLAIDATRKDLTVAIDTTRKDLTTSVDAARKDFTLGLSQTNADITKLRTNVDAIKPRLNATLSQADLDTALADKVTNTQLNSALADRVTTTQMDTALADRVTTTQMNTALSDRVTTAQLNAGLATRVDTATFNSFSGNVNQQFKTVNTSITTINGRLPRQ